MSFSCSFRQCFGFVMQQANQELVQNTGIDALGKVNQARYEAGRVGVHTTDPVYAAGDVVEKLNPFQKGAAGGGANGQPTPLQTPKERIVHTVDEFIALRDKISKTPHGGAVCFMHALFNWSNPQTRDIGEQMLVLATFEDNLIAGNTYKNYAVNDTIKSALEYGKESAEHVVPSYVVGNTGVQGGYMLDNSGYAAYSYNPASEQGDDTKDGVYTIYLWSTGDVNSPRYVTLKLNPKGYWKVSDLGNILSGVQQPWANPHAADEL